MVGIVLYQHIRGYQLVGRHVEGNRDGDRITQRDDVVPPSYKLNDNNKGRGEGIILLVIGVTWWCVQYIAGLKNHFEWLGPLKGKQEIG